MSLGMVGISVVDTILTLVDLGLKDRNHLPEFVNFLGIRGRRGDDSESSSLPPSLPFPPSPSLPPPHSSLSRSRALRVVAWHACRMPCSSLASRSESIRADQSGSEVIRAHIRVIVISESLSYPSHCHLPACQLLVAAPVASGSVRVDPSRSGGWMAVHDSGSVQRERGRERGRERERARRRQPPWPARDDPERPGPARPRALRHREREIERGGERERETEREIERETERAREEHRAGPQGLRVAGPALCWPGPARPVLSRPGPARAGPGRARFRSRASRDRGGGGGEGLVLCRRQAHPAPPQRRRHAPAAAAAAGGGAFDEGRHGGRGHVSEPARGPSLSVSLSLSLSLPFPLSLSLPPSLPPSPLTLSLFLSLSASDSPQLPLPLPENGKETVCGEEGDSDAREAEQAKVAAAEEEDAADTSGLRRAALNARCGKNPPPALAAAAPVAPLESVGVRRAGRGRSAGANGAVCTLPY
jgi:hypothetical protein